MSRMNAAGDGERRSGAVSRVVLVGIDGDRATGEARARLESLVGVCNEFYPCPPSLGEVLRLPFVRDDKGRRFCGLEAINSFIADEASGNTAE